MKNNLKFLIKKSPLHNISNIIWNNDILVFSHIKWNFVYRRPQHLMNRISKNRRVFYFEDPEYDENRNDYEITEEGKITVVTSYYNNVSDLYKTQKTILNEVLKSREIKNYLSWYFSPLAFNYSDDLKPDLIIYDCIEDADPENISENEIDLIKAADILFTGDNSSYKNKKDEFENLYYFPGSIDPLQYNNKTIAEPAEQAVITSPKIGFVGVIDDRFDFDLLDSLSSLKPEWSFILIGPLVGVTEQNIHFKNNVIYLGKKRYGELPAYISHWDAAVMPYKYSEDTRYINPSKVLEYLAAGKPVVSTPVKNVRSLYKNNIIHFADNAEQFVSELENCFFDIKNKDWQIRRKQLFSRNSWDLTYQNIDNIISSYILFKRLSKIENKIKEGLII